MVGPWCLVEAKLTDTKIAGQFANFSQRLVAPFDFQVVVELDHAQADSFTRPVPLSSFPRGVFSRN